MQSLHLLSTQLHQMMKRRSPELRERFVWWQILKLLSLIMEMKGQLDTVLHQQQTILQELGKTQMKNMPKLPAGIVLPLQTFEQVLSLDRKLTTSETDRQGLVWWQLYTQFSFFLIFYYLLVVRPNSFSIGGILLFYINSSTICMHAYCLVECQHWYRQYNSKLFETCASSPQILSDASV